jgi:hypothetical protein
MVIRRNQRKFRINDSELIIFAKNLVNTMIRDFELFEKSGIRKRNIEEFKTLCSDFESFPTDEIFSNELLLAQKIKNDYRKLIIEQLRKISLNAKICYCQKSMIYKKFKIRNMNNLSDEKLLIFATKISQYISESIIEQSNFGLTLINLQELNELTNNFENSLIDILHKINIRKSNTQKRLELANNLYKFVHYYCRIGIYSSLKRHLNYDDYIMLKNGIPPSKIHS